MDEEAAATMVDEAANLAIRHDGLSIRQCLILAGFSKEEAAGQNLRKRVSRRPVLVAARKEQKEKKGRKRGADYVTPETSSPQFPPPQPPSIRATISAATTTADAALGRTTDECGRNSLH